MNYLLRDIKLSKLTGIPMSGDVAKLYKFWEDLWCDMKVIINTEKGEIRCWKDDYNYCYFLQSNKNDNLWCDYNNVWVFFGYDLKLNYDEIQELIQHMVDETLNYEVNTPLLKLLSEWGRMW